MHIYDYLKNLKSGPVFYEEAPSIFGRNLKMVGHEFPYSIRPTEFSFLRNLVIDYDLKNGYEVATAFGISSLAAGLGFKETGGKLVTMDAYIEEKYDSFWTYQFDNPSTHPDMDGYKSAKFLMEHFGLEDTVFLEVGWSPDDTESCIRKHITEPLDYIFIDGGHFPGQFIQDMESIIPLLADEYIIAVHDNFPNMFTPEVIDYLETTFGKQPDIILPEPLGHNLSIYFNK